MPNADRALMDTLRLLVAFMLCSAYYTSASAQSYPIKPVRFLVGYAPGGGNDIIARILGAKLTEKLGQQVIIDNRAGATGIIANSIAAGAPADGYTILIVPASFSFDSSLHAKLPYDPLRQFIPVSLVAASPLIFIAHNAVPAKTIRDLVAIARAKPGQLNFAHGGTNGMSHMVVELLKSMAGVNMVSVAYKGAGPGLIALMSGQVDVQSTAILSAITQLKAGKVRALAVTSATRSPRLPDVPTVAESGFPDYDAPGWWGVLVPAGTPAVVVKRLGEAITQATRTAEVIEKLGQLGADAIGSSPEEFAAYIRSESAKWNKVIRTAGIRAE